MCMPPTVYIHSFYSKDKGFQTIASYSPTLSADWINNEERNTVFEVSNSETVADFLKKYPGAVLGVGK